MTEDQELKTALRCADVAIERGTITKKDLAQAVFDLLWSKMDHPQFYERLDPPCDAAGGE